jgi:hypothetical protein
VDAQGQTGEPDLAVFESLLQQALGDTVVAIHWDFAREALTRALGMPVVVGLEAVAPPDAVATPLSSPPALIP